MNELDTFLKEYERQTNTHNFDNVLPLISNDAIYWFSDGDFTGINEIKKAFEETWFKIKDEVYRIDKVEWLVSTDDAAVGVYNFEWKGIVNGIEKNGSGRGTNVLSRTNGKWQIVHEHLSKQVR